MGWVSAKLMKPNKQLSSFGVYENELMTKIYFPLE